MAYFKAVFPEGKNFKMNYFFFNSDKRFYELFYPGKSIFVWNFTDTITLLKLLSSNKCNYNFQIISLDKDLFRKWYSFKGDISDYFLECINEII